MKLREFVDPPDSGIGWEGNIFTFVCVIGLLLCNTNVVRRSTLCFVFPLSLPDAFIKASSKRSPVSFAINVRLWQFDNRWTNFYEISYWDFLLQIFELNLKFNITEGYFMWWPAWISACNALCDLTSARNKSCTERTKTQFLFWIQFLSKLYVFESNQTRESSMSEIVNAVHILSKLSPCFAVLSVVLSNKKWSAWLCRIWNSIQKK